MQEPLLGSDDGLVNAKGMKLAYREWVPMGGMQRGIVFLVHGAAGHSGRYHKLATFLTSKGLYVFGMDHQGHGRSDGDRCHIDSFQDYVSDLELFIRHVTIPAMESLPRFILGHSMGCLISVKAAMSPAFAGLGIRGLVLLSPSLAAKPASRTVSLKFMSSIAPKSEMGYSNTTQTHPLTHDEGMNASYQSDPLVYHGGLRAKFTSEVLKAMNEASKSAAALDTPILVLHGSENKINPPGPGSRGWFDKLCMEDKTYVSIEGGYHELHNEAEPYRSHTYSVIDRWISAHLCPAFSGQGPRQPAPCYLPAADTEYGYRGQADVQAATIMAV